MSNLLKTGALANATPFVVAVGGMDTPMRATLTSAAGGRLIELSSDGGANYWTPAVDVTSVGMVNVVILAPVSHVRFTGAAADIWNVR